MPTVSRGMSYLNRPLRCVERLWSLEPLLALPGVSNVEVPWRPRPGKEDVRALRPVSWLV